MADATTVTTRTGPMRKTLATIEEIEFLDRAGVGWADIIRQVAQGRKPESLVRTLDRAGRKDLAATISSHIRPYATTRSFR